jgi:hypothetical protein
VNYILIIIAAVLVITGIAVNRGSLVELSSENNFTNETYLGGDGNGVGLEETTEENTTIFTPTPQSAESGETANSLNLNDTDYWTYPGSAVISQMEKSLKLESGDSDEEITIWYRNRLENSGMSVNTFVITATNGNVFNNLVGADAEVEVRINISKQAEVDKVQIGVEII